MRRRHISLRLPILLMLAMLLPTVAVAHDFVVDGIYYNITSDNEVAVTNDGYYYTNYSGDVIIPSTVTYQGTTYSVTAIGKGAFMYNNGLTSISIGNSVASIGYAAFYNCSGLTDLIIPNSVTSIGDIAFSSCTGLKRLLIGSSVTSIGFNAFNGCVGLTSIIVDGGNQNFDSRDNCNALIETASNTLLQGCQNTIIPNSVTSIGRYAFDSCSGLTDLIIPNSVTSIGDCAFDDCTGLTNLTIPNSVTSIGNFAFSGCSGLTDLTIPNSVTSIGNYTLFGCSGLTSIIVENGNPNYDSRDNCNALIETASNTLLQGCQNTIIPSTVTSIGANAFGSCTGLTHIAIPSSIIAIGAYAFEGCAGLTSIIVENDNPNYDSRDNCNALIETASNTLLAGCQNTIIPNSVTSIGNSAFYGCSGLESIIIPKSVTTIQDWAFGECLGLTCVIIPNSVTDIGNYAFAECTGLDDVYSFIVDPSQISMGGDVFYTQNEDYSGRTLHVPNSNSVYWYQEDTRWSQYFGNIVESYLEVNGIYYRILSENEVAVKSSPNNNRYRGDIIIPEAVDYGGMTFTVTSIGFEAFYNCSGLTSVTIPNTVTSIGKYAFEACTGLSSIIVASDNPIYDSRENCNAIIETASNTLIVGCNNTVIPHSVITIGYAAFLRSGITNVVIPGSVQTIEEHAFLDCENLTDVTLSEGLLTIGEEALSGTGITEIQLPESLVRIGEEAFETTPLQTITLPKNVAFLGNEGEDEDDLYGGVFDDCPSLTEVNVDRLNTTYASRDGMLLTKDMKILLYFPEGRSGQCVIPNTVTTIYEDAFEGNIGLTSVTIPNAVTTIGGYAFYDCSALTLVKCLAVTPPEVNNNYSFNSDSYAVAVLEVPESSVDAYRNHQVWGRFQNIQSIAVVAGDVDGDGSTTIGDVTNLIDMLLNGGVSVTQCPGADVDGDGNITIGDVTRIIDMLLGKS